MKKPVCFSFVLVVALPIFLLGCNSIDSSFFNSTQTASSTPTPLVCPTLINTTPVPLSTDLGETKLVVVLFENNFDYKDYTNQIFQTVEFVAENAFQPGDKLFIVDMDVPDFDSSVVLVAGVEEVSSPLAPPAPTVAPTPTATLPPISTPQSQLQIIESTRSANATALSVNAERTKSVFYYDCAKDIWQQEYLEISEQWQEEKEIAVASFSASVESQLENIKVGNNISTPRIWEGLAAATVILENECYMYDRCILIIFSDMYEFRSIQPENLKINLQDIEVLGVMLNCKFLYSPECGDWNEKWKEYLYSNRINAKSVDFISGENLNRTLLQILNP